MKTYEAITSNYYTADHTVIGVNLSAMRYGDSREAVFHALIKKRGC